MSTEGLMTLTPGTTSMKGNTHGMTHSTQRVKLPLAESPDRRGSVLRRRGLVCACRTPTKLTSTLLPSLHRRWRKHLTGIKKSLGQRAKERSEAFIAGRKNDADSDLGGTILGT